LQLQETADALEQEKERTDQLLHSIMPAKVVAQLKAGEKVHETFEQVTGECHLLPYPLHIGCMQPSFILKYADYSETSI
jgi:hypothetical protein